MGREVEVYGVRKGVTREVRVTASWGRERKVVEVERKVGMWWEGGVWGGDAGGGIGMRLQ